MQIYYQIPLTPLGQKGEAKKYAKLRLIQSIWVVFAGKFELGLIWIVFGLFGGVRKPKTVQILPEIDLDLDLKNLRSRSISLQVHLQWTRSHKRSSSAWVISIFCDQDHWSYPSMHQNVLSLFRRTSPIWGFVASVWKTRREWPPAALPTKMFSNPRHQTYSLTKNTFYLFIHFMLPRSRLFRLGFPTLPWRMPCSTWLIFDYTRGNRVGVGLGILVLFFVMIYRFQWLRIATELQPKTVSLRAING